MTNLEQSQAKPDPQSLPWRFTEALFRFYEPFIHRYLELHPRILVVNPRDHRRSCETFCARMRDAMKSYKEHKWTSTINRARFLELHPTISVGQRRGLIYIGTLENIRKAIGTVDVPQLEPLPAATLVQPYDLAQHPRTEAEFSLLCELADRRLLTQPLLLTIPIEWVKSSLTKFDILLTPHGTNQHILQ